MIPMEELKVLIPLSDLLALSRAVDDDKERQNELLRLRRELEALRNMQHECMALLGDLRRQINKIERPGA